MTFRKFGSLLDPTARVQPVVGLGADDFAELLLALVAGEINSTDVGKCVKVGDDFFTLDSITPLTLTNLGSLSGFDVTQDANPTSAIVVGNTVVRRIIIFTQLDNAGLVNLPNVPAEDQVVAVKDGTGNAGANNITIDGGIFNIEGAGTVVISSAYGYIELKWNQTLSEWLILQTVP